MPNLTLSVTKEVKRRMSARPEIRWSNAVRAIIEKKLDDFESAEALAQKSAITQKDADLVSARVKRSVVRHVKGLMDEINS